MLEMQMKENMRNTHKVLPKVSKADYEWIIFYRSFLETCDLYSHSENVARLQDAIQCDEIKRAGAHNLFNPVTYLNTLRNINERIGKPERMLLNEKKKLMDSERIKSHDKKGLIEFIDKINRYSTLVDKLGVYANKTDLYVISRLSRLLPTHLSGKWSSHYNVLLDQSGEVLVSDMAAWLNSQIRIVETNLLFEKMDPYGEIKTRGGKNLPRHESKSKREKFFLHNEMDSSCSEEEDDNESGETFNAHSLKKELTALTSRRVDRRLTTWKIFAGIMIKTVTALYTVTHYSTCLEKKCPNWPKPKRFATFAAALTASLLKK